jgi:leader peptidase (prepilin peptidase) / N-methyltransferase
MSWWIPVRDGTAGFLLMVAGTELTGPRASVAESLFGALLPSAFLWLTGELFFRLRHKEGLGLGDVKMMMTIGAFLGLRGSLLTLITGSLLGSVLGLVFIFATKKDHSSYELPLGTFLGIAALGVSLTGQNVFAWVAGVF